MPGMTTAQSLATTLGIQFDDDELEAETAPEHHELPTEQERNTESNQENENDENIELIRAEDANKEDEAKPVFKKLRRPTPKIDLDMLESSNGIPLLLKTMEKEKFGGQGYERKDLSKLMGIYQAWADNLQPRFTFASSIGAIYKIGLTANGRSAMQQMRYTYEQDGKLEGNMVQQLEGNAKEDAVRASEVMDEGDDFGAWGTGGDEVERQTPKVNPVQEDTRRLQHLETLADDMITMSEKIERNRLRAMAKKRQAAQARAIKAAEEEMRRAQAATQNQEAEMDVDEGDLAEMWAIADEQAGAACTTEIIEPTKATTSTCEAVSEGNEAPVPRAAEPAKMESVAQETRAEPVRNVTPTIEIPVEVSKEAMDTNTNEGENTDPNTIAVAMDAVSVE
eukprot:Clim_evm19s167 gene=Clim_evmTU19s167